MRRREPEVPEIEQLSTLDLFRRAHQATLRRDFAERERLGAEIRRRSSFKRLRVSDE